LDGITTRGHYVVAAGTMVANCVSIAENRGEPARSGYYVIASTRVVHDCSRITDSGWATREG